MALNLCIESLPDTTVNLSPLFNTYVIDAVSNGTYTYNLFTRTCEGQTLTLTRIDGTNATVTLVGNIRINSTNRASTLLLPYSTITIVSAAGVWYMISNEIISSKSVDAVFTSFFGGALGVTYMTIIDSRLFLRFPFLGTNNYSTITSILTTFGNAVVPSDGTIRLYRSDATLICTVNIPVSSTVVSYNLTASEKNLLPAAIDSLYLTYNGSSPVDISSMIFYP